MDEPLPKIDSELLGQELDNQLRVRDVLAVDGDPRRFVLVLKKDLISQLKKCRIPRLICILYTPKTLGKKKMSSIIVPDCMGSQNR